MSNKEDLIGKVKLDYTFYSEQNDNSDDSFLDELLEIVKNSKEDSYDQIIIDRKSWPILYHLSPFRENIINWFPIDKNAKVLEIGSECGAITGALTRKAGMVHSIESSYKSSLINAYRHQESGNLTISVGDYRTILSSTEEKYDYITLINSSSLNIESIQSLKEHLKPDGLIIITANNRLGLRYLSGYTDTTDKFTKAELRDGLNNSGLSDYCFYYPYPDSVMPTTIYTDDHLPDAGELIDNIRNFDRPRIVYWDEATAYDDIIKEQVFPSFSNSFLITIGKNQRERVVYAKISDNRDIPYRIITTLHKEEDKLSVRKTNRFPEGSNWIKTIQDNEAKLSSVFKDKARVLRSTLHDNYIEYEFINGTNMSSYLSAACSNGKIVSIIKALDQYYYLIKLMKTYDTFTPGEDFKRVFGDVDLPEELESGSVVNIDLIPANVICTKGEFNIIDCEWVFDFSIPIEYVFWRGLFYNRDLSMLDNDIKEQLYNHYGLNKQKRDTYLRMENSFQALVYGDAVRLPTYFSSIPMQVETIEHVQKDRKNKETEILDLNSTINNLNSTINDLNVRNKYLENVYNSKSVKILRKIGIIK